MLDAKQVDGDYATRPTSGRLDYLFASPTLYLQGAQVYDCGDEGLMGGLPLEGLPLPATTCSLASDHLPVFADLVIPTGPDEPFAEVPPTSWAYGYINAIRKANITGGCGDGNYCPQGLVTREQMAAFLVRAVEGEPSDNYCEGSSFFSDVPPDAWSCSYIKRLVELGFTQGCGAGEDAGLAFQPLSSEHDAVGDLPRFRAVLVSGPGRNPAGQAPHRPQQAPRRSAADQVLDQVHWHLPDRMFVKGLNRQLVGHYNYYELRGNSQDLWRFFQTATEYAFKWLNRRGGKRKNFTWQVFNRAMARLGIAKPRITGSLRRNECLHEPFARAKASTTEEPDAGILHVRDCAGGAGNRRPYG